MTSARVSAVVLLLLFGVSAIAQNHPGFLLPTPLVPPVGSYWPISSTPVADWNVVAQQSFQSDTAEQQEDKLRAKLAEAVARLDANSDLGIVITPADMDGACFTIRSIVVARDRKDSDATHFVRTSTCQPSSRYRLRTAEQTDSSGH